MRSRKYVSQQFGADVKWAAINSALWSAISARKDHALTLTGVDAVAKTASAEPNEVLAVLALLSRPGAQMLKMEFRESSTDGTEISQKDFAEKLAGWWKKKTLSEPEWRSFATQAKVRWVPVGVATP
jgi:hypothetical protein